MAFGGYLYHYSLNIYVQKFRIYANLYFKHHDYATFARSILTKPNVKEVGYKYGSITAEYFQPGTTVSQQQLSIWETQLKEHSLFFAKVIDGEVFFHIGSIPYKNKVLLAGVVYNSNKTYTEDCLARVNSVSHGTCFEKYNSNWLISYNWHERILSP